MNSADASPRADSVAAELPGWMTHLPGARHEVEDARQRIHRIDRLSRAGLAEPGPRGDGDGRSRPIRLTAAGRRRWRAATDERIRVEDRLVGAALDAAGLDALDDLLVRFEDELGHAPARGPVRRR